MDVQEALLNTHTMQGLSALTKKAEPHLSFLGCRYVTVKPFEGALPLNQLGVQRDEIYFKYITPKESGKKYFNEIHSRLWKIYELSDKQANTCNWITYIFTMVRDTLTIYCEGGKGRRFWIGI